jgi:hypothetical protein
MAMRFPPRPLAKLKNLLSFKHPMVVKRGARPYIEMQGWKQVSRTTPPEWHGYYRIRFRSYKGKIKASTPPQFYIYKPPEALTTRHSHRACFTTLADGWCSVHFRIMPRDLDSGVMQLERILREAFLLSQTSA